TSETLEEGVHYRITASGAFNLSNSGQRADAEWGRFQPYPEEFSRTPIKVKYGVGIYPDDPATTGDDAITLSTTRTPFWGDPSGTSDHAYTINYLGAGIPLRFFYQDSYYKDNSYSAGDAHMRMTIYRALPAMPGFV